MSSPCPDVSSDLLDSSGATLDTVVERTSRINLDDTVGSDDIEEALRENGGGMLSDMSDGGLSQTSEGGCTAIHGGAGAGGSAVGSSHSSQQQQFPSVTKVYYHIDDEPTPYMTEVHLSPDLITLGDVKRVLMRTNFRYFTKTLDPDLGYEVKAELRDDMDPLHRASSGRFELFLLTIDGSTTSDGSSGQAKSSRHAHHHVPGPAPQTRYGMMNQNPNLFRQAVHQFDNSMMSTDSESMISAAIPHYMMKGSLNRRHLTSQQQQHYPQPGHRGRRFEDSTIGSESDARMFSDEDDRGSTTTDITSVSRQHENMYRKRRSRRQYHRKPSRASSFSSITESSMSLDVITVNLNMDTVNFLGISIVGQSSARGDSGIYVANIMKGGAVALDGRIEAGDMILQVNDISFENFTNDQAVDVLRDAVARKGPIKLTVAKCFDNGPKSCFTIPRNSREEPVRPIDTQAWIQHTNAMRGMPSILEGSEGAPTPIPGEWPHGRPPSSSTVTSTGSNGQNTVVTGHKLHVTSDKKKIVEMMAMPNSGLEIKDRTWLKFPIPMAFLGSDLVDWLLGHVDGLSKRNDAQEFAEELLRLKLISHTVKKKFIEQSYYILGPECAEFARYRLLGPDEMAAPSSAGMPPGGRWQWTTAPPPAGAPKGGQAASMVSGYASMPVSPYPHFQATRGGAGSQISGGSGEGSGSGSDHKRRAVVLPPAPSTSQLPSRLDDLPSDLASSRQSFRMAMNTPYEFFVDKL